MVQTIPLTRGYVALVDDEDYENLSRFKWRAVGGVRGIYAARAIGGRKHQVAYMHRDVLQTDAPHIDHINHDRLDNRRCNLRAATSSLNAANGRLMSSNTSGFRGVRWHKEAGWCAEITVRRVRRHLGSFRCIFAAAAAYDAAAREAFGEFAYSNLAGLPPCQCPICTGAA